ncbi:unnamed protein product [Ceratitis capitata]|uniref:(Mediterranean fruit fly) hypothetical protein n=1 Tax=Ceratitis capitata TaxID=7213 RepID=A0A811U4Q9_CERCA|nr:unnamed protein product [Ceratitis capitata]
MAMGSTSMALFFWKDLWNQIFLSEDPFCRTTHKVCGKLTLTITVRSLNDAEISSLSTWFLLIFQSSDGFSFEGKEYYCQTIV